MAFVVVYDACVLYPNTLRDLLIRVGQARIMQARWTEQILDEVDRALAARPIEESRRRVLRERMNAAIRDCLITGHEPLIEGLKLPDPDDRHVLAAAIKAGAQVIVTSNLKDFPSAYLAVRSAQGALLALPPMGFPGPPPAPGVPVSRHRA
ncbi:PIN domain-containing protein, partial [Streptacidiphilus sp. EB103A]|uniref:PIN domain-containing protein n=1 Tax=Streptacidiphilus sp. EB103A TaxID=3156275 RepID=UPI00351216D4